MRVVLAFSAGLAIGAVSTWLYLSEKYKHILDGDDVEDVSEEDIATNEEISETYKATIGEPVVGRIEPKEEASPSSIIRKVAQKVDYSKAAEVIGNDVVKSAVEAVVNPSGKEYLQEENDKRPIKIGPAQFADEKQFFDKISLVYYLGDEVLALHPDEKFDEDEGESAIIENVDKVIGKENLKYFGEYEPGMLYVRNESEGKDYCVELKYGKYSNGIHMK